MQVIDCDCGHTLQAANDDDLLQVARQHMEQEHGNQQVSDDELKRMIADQAYTAMDS
jgi:predicted small metal-binding protein